MKLIISGLLAAILLAGCGVRENIDNVRITFDGVFTLDYIGPEYPNAMLF